VLRIRAVRLLQQQLLLAADLCVLAGRHACARDDHALARVGDLWRRTQELHPGLLLLSTSRSAPSFEQVWADKSCVLPRPDVLLLAGGTHIVYRTPAGFESDGDFAAWLSAPSTGWQRARVAAAAALLIERCQQRRHVAAATTGMLDSAVRLPPRVKLDTAKQQGKHRVRLLVSGGLAAAEAVAEELEELLSDEAARMQQQASPLGVWAPSAGQARRAAVSDQQAHAESHHWGAHPRRPRELARLRMAWRVLVYRHVEGGGKAHRSWCALDVVPICAGPAAAQRHVLLRFGLSPDLVVGFLDAGGAEPMRSAQLCGRGSVLVGTRPVADVSNRMQLLSAATDDMPLLLSQKLGPAAVEHGLYDLGLC